MSAAIGKPAFIPDAIFFHKTQILVDATLLYMGRLDPRSQWTVERIKTYKQVRKGVYQGKSVKCVERLSDEVTLRRRGTSERRTASFAYLSYSAIWRLMP